jgi:hypothetical protein
LNETALYRIEVELRRPKGEKKRLLNDTRMMRTYDCRRVPKVRKEDIEGEHYGDEETP